MNDCEKCSFLIGNECFSSKSWMAKDQIFVEKVLSQHSHVKYIEFMRWLLDLIERNK